jgi:hypothetical protein
MQLRKGEQPGASKENLPDLGQARDAAGKAVCAARLSRAQAPAGPELCAQGRGIGATGAQGGVPAGPAGQDLAGGLHGDRRREGLPGCGQEAGRPRAVPAAGEAAAGRPLTLKVVLGLYWMPIKTKS